MADWWIAASDTSVEPSFLRETFRYPYWPVDPVPDRELSAPVSFGRDAVRLDPRFHIHRRSIPVESLQPDNRRRQLQAVVALGAEGPRCYLCFRQLQAWWWDVDCITEHRISINSIEIVFEALDLVVDSIRRARDGILGKPREY